MTKKKTNTFTMKAPSNSSELGFVQFQDQTKSTDRSITVVRRIAERFIGGVSSIHFSNLAGTPSSMAIDIGAHL